MWKKVHAFVYIRPNDYQWKMFQVHWRYLCESDMWIYVIAWIVGCFFCFDLCRLLMTYMVIHLIAKLWYDLIDLIGKYALIFLLLFAIFSVVWLFFLLKSFFFLLFFYLFSFFFNLFFKRELKKLEGRVFLKAEDPSCISFWVSFPNWWEFATLSFWNLVNLIWLVRQQLHFLINDKIIPRKVTS